MKLYQEVKKGEDAWNEVIVLVPAKPRSMPQMLPSQTHPTEPRSSTSETQKIAAKMPSEEELAKTVESKTVRNPTTSLQMIPKYFLS